ncbi:MULTISPECIES: FadR/GntR family transcriptional regulator [unclassified Microbacterium]|uniref:FadR/GntR family transcriptional regulator n=1 Tax=unclassified Microbacterium TaxID=2609290 RepID=UPI003745743F
MVGRTHQGSHSHVVQQLGRRITGEVIAPGTVLTLAGLEEEFTASRTVVREAVRVLESHGLLQSRRRVGVTVLPRSQWNSLNASVIQWTLDGPRRRQQLIELMELRAAVEPAAARLAAERATTEQRAELVRWANELSERGGRGEGDSEAYLAADVAYHSALLAASGNALLSQMAQPVREILEGRSSRGLTPAVPHEGTLEAHVATATAIAAGDGEAAEAAARTHLMLVAGEVRGD